MRRDQDHVRMRATVQIQPPCEIEAVLASQVDVDERHVRPELVDETKRVGAVRRAPDDIPSFLHEERGSGLEEGAAVVNDEAPQRHPLQDRGTTADWPSPLPV